MNTVTKENIHVAISAACLTLVAIDGVKKRRAAKKTWNLGKTQSTTPAK